jgi:hypothetical protein
VVTAIAAALLAASFGASQPVAIEGWSGDAMEPFIARDGSVLFFNNRNGPGDHTDLFWARRIDSVTFHFEGPVAGANSPALDGVASLARDGTFAFISPRDYDKTRATIWTGFWRDGRVERLALQAGLSLGKPAWFSMDAELSADGHHLYFTQNEWRPGSFPKSSALVLGTHEKAGWRVDPAGTAWLSLVNAAGFVYAPATSADERELYVTRLTPGGLFQPPHLDILVATRDEVNQPFSKPETIAAISGYVEGPSVASDGALYFHKKVGPRFVIMRSARGPVRLESPSPPG